MSRLTCTQCEGMLLDAADGILLPDEQTHFDLHLSECAACTRMLTEVRRGGAWMEMLKEAPPIPAADLVDRILAKTSGDPHVASSMVAQVAHSASIFGNSQSNVLPFRVPPAMQPRTRMGRMVHTVMQPRFAMTAAMAFFSIALTLNIAGVRLSALRASDLKPSNVRKSFWAADSRVVQYYENLRVVYELESRVREMQRESDTDNTPRRGLLNTPQPEQPTRQAPSGPPRSSTPRLHRDAPSQAMQRTYRIVPVHNIFPRTAAGSNGSEGVQA